MTKEQLKELFSKLTLEEKAAQMLQLTGYFFQGSGISTGPDSEMELPEQMVKNAGSILNVTGIERLRQVQEHYLEQSTHKIPLLFMADVINGFRTVFPIPLAQGCSFDTGLVEAAAHVAAEESSEAGLHVTFSPMVDLVRDPRWGRVMESTGEDACLNGRMAAAMIRGYQGESLCEPDRIAACTKHFAAYGAPEGGREYNSVDMSEKKLREEYLPAYHAAVDADSALIMTAFNTVNGVPATCNDWLTRDILRGEWGFDGVVISDYSALFELMTHGVADSLEEAAKLSLNAGIDMDMVSPVYAKALVKLAQKNETCARLLDEGAFRVLELKNKLGLFEDPFRGRKNQAAGKTGCDEFRLISRKLAEESVVLLKNNNILPLGKENKKIALIGPMADSPLLCGSWSLFYQQEDVITLKEGLAKVYEREIADGELEITYAQGCHILEKHRGFLSFRRQYLENDLEKQGVDEESMIRAAVELAKKADTVILALGEHPHQSGEGGARADITLSPTQLHLFEQIHQVNSRVIVVLFHGRPLAIPQLSQHAGAVLAAWYPGTEGGLAVANLLSGKANPSGKLSMTFPRGTGQIPIYYSHLKTGRPAVPGIENRFSSTYIDEESQPLYPFGYGLSYSSFEYRDFRVEPCEMNLGGSVTVTGMICNTSGRKGTEVVQCYVQDLVGSTARPVRELKDFVRVELDAGQETEVSFTLREEKLRFFTKAARYESEPGKFVVYVGGDSEAPLVGEFSYCTSRVVGELPATIRAISSLL